MGNFWTNSEVPKKVRFLGKFKHCVTCHKTTTRIFGAVKTSNIVQDLAILSPHAPQEVRVGHF
jgi:hypothetical protein